MSKPYQTESYDEEDDTKEYINLFSLGPIFLSTSNPNLLDFTMGTNAYDDDAETNAGIFSNVNKTSSMNYSNGIITINKSGTYQLRFTGLFFVSQSRALLFFVKKNEITIAETAIQVTTNNNRDNVMLESFMFLSPIFNINSGDTVRIDVRINSDTGYVLNQNVFLQEI
tara:strand:+ start:896 stop:1402 length:507 start_codon:yes stop_codon:yes gene_type:complete